MLKGGMVVSRRTSDQIAEDVGRQQMSDLQKASTPPAGSAGILPASEAPRAASQQQSRPVSVTGLSVPQALPAWESSRRIAFATDD